MVGGNVIRVLYKDGFVFPDICSKFMVNYDWFVNIKFHVQLTCVWGEENSHYTLFCYLFEINVNWLEEKDQL